MSAGMITKAVGYLGCEVRLSDCLISKTEILKNCECWEKLPKEVRDGLKKATAGAGVYCPVCQNPVDKKVSRRELKFFSGLRAEAEASPETTWPKFLATATAEQNGTSKGYRIFPVYDKGNVRRDVVIFGLPIWTATGAFNGPMPMDPTSAKHDEVKSWLTKLGIFHQPSFSFRLYFSQEPSAPNQPGMPTTPVAKPGETSPVMARPVEIPPEVSRPIIRGGAAAE